MSSSNRGPGTGTNPVQSLIKAMENPTKLGIILLLLERERMTVTQMQKFMGLSRANLYHFVQELVKAKVLTEPESVVKGNYVEKYYRINPVLRHSGYEQQKIVLSAGPEELRNIISSFFISLSLHFRLYAQRALTADSKKLVEIASAAKRGKMMLTFHLMSKRKFEYVVSEFADVLKTAHRKFDEIGAETSRLVVVALPEAVLRLEDKD
jgi:DNA-binding transcriptional ArsR family regulator